MRAFDALVEKFSGFDGVPLLLIRIFLAPIMIYAGLGKLQLGADVGFFQQFLADPNVVAWFGNPSWGLGLPAPDLLAFLAAWTELLGGWLLLLGLYTRLASLPLMFTMVVAAGTAHWDNGGHALPEAKLTVPWEWRMDLIEAGTERKAAAISILKQHGNYGWLTEAGSITVLKSGIEFAATYFVMLMVLFFYGGGRYVSIDYWLAQRYRRNVLS